MALGPTAPPGVAVGKPLPGCVDGQKGREVGHA